MNEQQPIEKSSGVPSQEEPDKKEEVKSGLWQVIKFGLVGVLNTVIDFAILNALSWMTGVTKGAGASAIALVAFTAAVTNSYLWNKFWTFKQKGKENLGGEISKFLTVSLIGAALNAGIIYIITTLVDPLFGLSETLWLNAAKILAVLVVFAWNFVGYKFWAFKESA